MLDAATSDCCHCDADLPTASANVVETLVARFGGLTNLSSALGHQHPTTVQGWQRRGVVPVRQITKVIEAAAAKGFALTAADLLSTQPPVRRAQAAGGDEGPVSECDRRAGAFIRRTRKRQGLTLQALAARSGLHYVLLQRYEVGKRRIPLGNLEQIASGLGIDPVSIIAGTEAGASTREAALERALDHLIHAAQGAVNAPGIDRYRAAFDEAIAEGWAAIRMPTSSKSHA